MKLKFPCLALNGTESAEWEEVELELHKTQWVVLMVRAQAVVMVVVVVGQRLRQPLHHLPSYSGA